MLWIRLVIDLSPPLPLRLGELLPPCLIETREQRGCAGFGGQGVQVLEGQGLSVRQLHQRPYPAEEKDGEYGGLVLAPG